MRRPPWAWRLAVRAVLGLLRGLFGWRVRARLPDVPPRPDQPLVVVFNHTSAIDAFLVVDTVWRRLRHVCQPLVKEELFQVPGLRTLARRAGAIPVARGEGAGRATAYRHAVARSREGATILVAPESTITHDGSLLPLRHGAARLALEAGADVLVVTHFGAPRGFSPVVRFPDRGVIVTMTMDVLAPSPDDDAASLTWRIAATMLDRSAELQASYPQADPDARWWPPYSVPAPPTATAHENLARYQQSMTEGVAQARERMAHIAGQARQRMEELAVQAREHMPIPGDADRASGTDAVEEDDDRDAKTPRGTPEAETDERDPRWQSRTRRR